MGNMLDFDLAKSVDEYFRLNEQQTEVILKKVIEASKDIAKHWNSRK